MNYNDYIRKYIASCYEYKENKEEKDVSARLKDLYGNIYNNKNKLELFLGTLYSTSYIITSTLYEMYPNDSEISSYVEFLNSFYSLEQLISSIDEESFYALCKDSLYFNSLDLYAKKYFITNSLKHKSKILRISPSYINDLLFYNKKYEVSLIIEEYKRRLKEIKDEKVALEDTICYVVELLIKLEEQDSENYNEIIHNIVDEYYEYNKYLLANNLPCDEYANEIVEEIEYNRSDFIFFTVNNSELLEALIRDYLMYNLLPKEEKEKIKQGNNQYDFNPNKKVRKVLFDLFNEFDIEDESCVIKFKPQLDYIKNNSSLFECVTKVLYLDAMSYYSFEYYSYPSNEDIKNDYEYMEDIGSLNEFKQILLEDDYMFLNYIYTSCIFSMLSLVDKKQMIDTLISNNAYNKFVDNSYMFDAMEYNREYCKKDIMDIYYDELNKINDKKTAIACASAELSSELIDLEILYKDNYNKVIYDILKEYYEYILYCYSYDKNKAIDLDDKIIGMMEKDLDTFIKVDLNDFEILLNILQKYYESNTCDNILKQNIKNNFEILKCEGKAKIFIKK